jgi:hypothetical protein
VAHEIEMKIPTTKAVMNADVVFEIRCDGEKLGELHVSKGSIDWYHANAKKPTKMRWERFDEVMEAHRR